MNLQFLFVRMRQQAPLMLALLCTLVAVASYMQALEYPFVSDDEFYIVNNSKLAGLHLAELWRLFTEPYNPYEFLPLRDFSYWFDITLFGLAPSAFRVHNVILYLLCLPLVYFITLGFWRYFRPSDTVSAPLAAAVVTALFAVNPSHVEAVVWISGRKDVLSTLLSLLALWFAQNAKFERGLSHGYATASLVALLAAMLSKATAVAVAPVIAMLWIVFWNDNPKQDRRYLQLLWPFAGILLAAVVVVMFSASSAAKAVTYFGAEVIVRALAVLGWLARLAVSPESRHFIYPVLDDPNLPFMAAIGAVILLIAATCVAVILRKRSMEGFALIAFVLLCMPYFQLIPFRTHSLVSDRFLTIAVWPAALLVVSLLWRLKKVYRTVILAAIVLLWSLQTVESQRDWRSGEALWEADLRAYPGHYLPTFQLITIYRLPQSRYREAGELASRITVPEARDVVTKLTEVAGDLREASISGDPGEAMVHLKNLELLLTHPPGRANWDPTMHHFWRESQNYFVFEWESLVRSFPDNADVRANAKLSLVSVLKLVNKATWSPRLP